MLDCAISEYSDNICCTFNRFWVLCTLQMPWTMEVYMTVPIFTTSSRTSHNPASTQSNGHCGPYPGAFTVAKRNPKPGFCIFKTWNKGFDKEFRVYSSIMPQLILGAGSQPLRLHKPNSRLALLSTWPAVTFLAHFGHCEIPWERVPYLSTVEVCSWRGAIQIHVYLYLWDYTR